MNCDSTIGEEGYIFFHIQIINKTMNPVQIIGYSENKNDYTGFYLMSRKFRTGAIKLNASANKKLRNLDSTKIADIWLYLNNPMVWNEIKHEYQKGSHISF